MWNECDTTIQHIRHAWTVIIGIISPGLTTSVHSQGFSLACAHVDSRIVSSRARHVCRAPPSSDPYCLEYRGLRARPSASSRGCFLIKTSLTCDAQRRHSPVTFIKLVCFGRSRGRSTRAPLAPMPAPRRGCYRCRLYPPARRRARPSCWRRSRLIFRR